MTRVLWALIKEKLILPYVELKAEYYDLGLENGTNGRQGHADSRGGPSSAWRRGQVRTITPNQDRVKEYNLKKMWLSAQRDHQGGPGRHRFPQAILLKNIVPSVPRWTKPIMIGRHAYGMSTRMRRSPCPAGKGRTRPSRALTGR
jgi:isocitrate dehydrogenase